MNRRRLRASFAVAGLLTATLALAQPAPEQADPLADLLLQYVRADDADARQALLRPIAEACAGDWRRAADALAQLSLWEPVAPELTALEVDLSSRGRVKVACRLPEHYDPAQAYPVVLCLLRGGHDVDRASLEAVQRVLLEPERSGTDQAIVLMANLDWSGDYAEESPAGAWLSAVLRATRQAVHVDADRVYLVGLADSSAAGWLLALHHSPWFAGAVLGESLPVLPCPQSAWPLLLGNARALPIVCVREPAVAATESEELAQRYGVMAAVLRWAQGTGLPIRSATGNSEANAALTAMLARPRSTRLGERRQWFRYEGQGDLGWLRCSRLRDDPWRGQQLSVVTTPGVDRGQFADRVLRDRLQYLSGRITGQRIEIECKGCATLELALPAGAVDFDQPVQIVVNGQARRPRRLEPSLTTLLASAHATWDFAHPAAVRVRIAVRSDADPGEDE